MIEVNISKLENYKEQITDILGSEFTELMDSFQTTGMNQADANRIESKTHPFAKWWRAFKQDIDISRNTGQLHLSEFSMLLLYLLSDLYAIRDIPDRVRILNSLKGKSAFFSACFEASITASYKLLGYDIEIVKEKSKDGVRTSDLRIITKDAIVFLECKSLDDFKLRESPLWDELLQRIDKTLRKYNKSWAVTIFAGRQIAGRDKEVIFNTVCNAIKNNCLGEALTADGHFLINCVEILKWGQEILGSINIRQISEIGSLATETMIGVDGVPIHKNVTIINVAPHVELDISTRLISEFKKAIGQIPREGPGIIHIAIPYKIGVHLLQVIDQVYPKIYKKLNNESKRVNAVVISSAVFEKNLETPLVYNHYIVPNNYPRTKLPKDFKIIGTHDIGIPISDKEGTVEFVFGIKKEIKPGTPSILFDHCDRDGKHQLKVWTTWTDKLRMDLVTPTLGRIFIEAPYNDFRLDKKYFFAGTWCNKELCIYLDGEKKAVKEIEIR